MALIPSNGLIPTDLNDMSSITTIENLDDISFAALIPVMIPIISASRSVEPAVPNRKTPFCTKFSYLVRQRATEPAVVSAISAVLTQPLTSQADLGIVNAAFAEFIYDFTEDGMLSYRQALTTLSALDSDVHSDPRYTGSLPQQARDVIRFMGNREVAWAPGHESDYMAERSLKERIQTAREMRQHVDGLLGWLKDGDWPPYAGCEAQLARFPQITIMPIRKVLMEHRGNGKWICNLLRFVQDRVPVGRSWEAMYPQVNMLINKPNEDEELYKTATQARSWIETLNIYRSSQEGLRCA